MEQLLAKVKGRWPLAVGFLLVSCIPEWVPPSVEDRIHHQNDTLALSISMTVNHSSRQFVDTLVLAGRVFELALRASPDRGHGILFVYDHRDSILEAWSFQKSDSRQRSFNERPFRTVLSLRDYSGGVWVRLYGKQY